MSQARRKLVLGLVACFCCLIIAIMSAAAIDATVSKANLIGIIAGSFAAGATLVNAIKDHYAHRSGD